MKFVPTEWYPQGDESSSKSPPKKQRSGHAPVDDFHFGAKVHITLYTPTLPWIATSWPFWEFSSTLEIFKIILSLRPFLIGGKSGKQLSLNAAKKPVVKEVSVLTKSFYAYELIPEGTQWYTYSGSLTTPPCAENIEWSVAQDVISITDNQNRKLVELVLGFTNPDGYGEENTGTVASLSGSTCRPPQPTSQWPQGDQDLSPARLRMHE